ncbi:O-antigen ligase family protein [Mucilaginibacter sp.]|uniref:O-antigen ligase family protein n=1 Tax=Mucilaginibacter sp. TaxID=1882438 RepID=UPI0035BBDEF5
MFIFPLIFIVAFFVAMKEVLKGNRAGILIFLIFGLSIYTTAMSVTFMLGLKTLIPFFQFFKEILVSSVLTLNFINLKRWPKFHLIDYLILAFLGYTVLYTILPIGEQNFLGRLLALKSMSFYIAVYFAGRLFDPKDVYINKYFSYVALLTVAAGAVLCVELAVGVQMQTYTGFTDYIFYFFNMESGGSFGLVTTFESDGGYRRFASFFSNPLEYAAATLIALSIILSLYTTDNNKLKINNFGMMALAASFLAIIFALSRAPLASYFIVIYIYTLITKRKTIIKIIHAGFVVAVVYVIYLFIKFENSSDGLVAVLLSTIDFSNPSSVGHLQQWLEGILAMIAHPLGLGLGASGRVAGAAGENVGGENQFIIIGVQAGIIALLLYLITFVNFIRVGIRWLPKLEGKERKVCMAVLLIKVGLIIPLLTSEVESSSYISFMNWFFSGLLISLIMQPKTPTVTAA